MTGRPKLCRGCGKLMGVGEVCPYCGARQGGVRMGRRNPKAAIRMKVRFGGDEGTGGLTVTGTLIIIHAFFFVTALIVGGQPEGGGMDFLAPSTQVLFKLGAQYNAAVAAGEWWRLVMSVFLHFGALHILFNSYLTWQAGRILESDMGGRVMFLVYFVTGVAGFVASYWLGGPGLTAGASGAVSGLLGWLIVRRRLLDGHFKHPLTRSVINLVVLNALIGIVLPIVNNTAHLFGFLSGALMGWALTRMRSSATSRRVIGVFTALSLCISVAAIGFMLRSLPYGTATDLVAASHCWRDVIVDVNGPFRADRAQGDLTCLSKLVDLEPAANLARDHAIEALRSSLTAFERGASVGDLTAFRSELADAATIYKAWELTAHPRYGPFLRFDER